MVRLLTQNFLPPRLISSCFLQHFSACILLLSREAIKVPQLLSLRKKEKRKRVGHASTTPNELWEATGVFMAALCDFFSELGPKGLLSPVSLELKVGGEGN